jgi:lysophospholipase L1-like esterase
MTRRSIRLAVVLGLLGAVSTLARPVLAQADKWATELAAFEGQDRQAPAIGGIVFVGSSTIRLWDLAKYFPGLPAINRGFGGSEIGDSVNHVDLLVIRHKPRTVIFYAGDNDIAAGKSPQQIANAFKAFAGKVRAALPDTRLAFIAIKPSIQRWALIAQIRQANALVREYCDADDHLGFIDVDGPMLGWDAKPRKDLFIADGLHLSPKGYALWTTLVEPFVEPVARSQGGSPDASNGPHGPERPALHERR